MIIRTRPYTKDEVQQIIAIRAETERIQLHEDAQRKLAEIGANTSLRYLSHASNCKAHTITLAISCTYRHAVQLLTPASILARATGGENAVVTVDIIDEVASLFVDAKESAKVLLANKDAYIHQ